MIFFVTISLTFETIPRYTNRIENGRLTFDFSFILFHRYDRKRKFLQKGTATFNNTLEKNITGDSNKLLFRAKSLSFFFFPRKKKMIRCFTFFFRYFRNNSTLYNKIKNGRLTFDFSFEKRKFLQKSGTATFNNTPLIHSKRILQETVINHARAPLSK